MRRDQRNYFRIHYPKHERPIFRTGLSIYRIEDLSENGLVFSAPSGFGHLVNEDVEGYVRFRDGTEYKVKGEILRKAAYRVVLELKTGIPLPQIRVEERSLLQKYKK